MLLFFIAWHFFWDTVIQKNKCNSAWIQQHDACLGSRKLVGQEPRGSCTSRASNFLQWPVILSGQMDDMGTWLWAVCCPLWPCVLHSNLSLLSKLWWKAWATTLSPVVGTTGRSDWVPHSDQHIDSTSCCFIQSEAALIFPLFVFASFYSLGIIYGVFSFANLLAPTVVTVLGPKMSMFLSGLLYR